MKKKSKILLFMFIIILLLILFLILINKFLFYTFTPDHQRKAKNDINSFKTCILMYGEKHPTTKQGLGVFIKAGLIRRVPLDPWGNEYQYRSPGLEGRPYDIWSYGADGKPGGIGEDKDVLSWEIK